MRTDHTYRLVQIAVGGLTGYYAPAHRLETTSLRALPEFLDALEEGGVAIDIRDAIDRDFRLALRAPYVDPFLPNGRIGNEHGLEPAHLTNVAHGFWGAEASLMLDTADGFSFTGFDTVALDIYVEFWHRNGARIGCREGGTLRWRDEAPGAVLPTLEQSTG